MPRYKVVTYVTSKDVRVIEADTEDRAEYIATNAIPDEYPGFDELEVDSVDEAEDDVPDEADE